MTDRRTGSVGVTIDLAPLQGTTYPVTVTARQSTGVGHQVCAPTAYATLETRTYAELEASTYAELEQYCQVRYTLSGTVQQSQTALLRRVYGLVGATQQAQSVALLSLLTRRYQLTVTAQVSASLTLVSQQLAKPAKVFAVSACRTLMFGVCQRAAHFRASARDVRFRVEVR